jgi:hypothetical protein
MATNIYLLAKRISGGIAIFRANTYIAMRYYLIYPHRKTC